MQAMVTRQSPGERPKKEKTIPCKYCSKRFRRVEHVQRHERTHTKEKPFACTWVGCGKSFGRRDLLVRHEKLVHLNEGSGNGTRPRKASSASQTAASPSRGARLDPEVLSPIQRRPPLPPSPLQPQRQQQHYAPESIQPGIVAPLPSDPRMASRAHGSCNLDILSDAANLASAGEAGTLQPTMMQGLSQPQNSLSSKPYQDGMGYGDRSREQDTGVVAGHSAYSTQPPQTSFDDYNLFLDECAHFLAPSLEAEQSFGLWPRLGGASKPSSAFPSRFPSVQPDPRDSIEGGPRIQEDGSRTPSWRVSAADHGVIKNRLDEYSSVLPLDFVFPSRHTLTRFLDGYIMGHNDHLPFLHLPTLNPTELSPELLLAILAVGAVYRFETNRGHALWYAAKAVVFEQIRRRRSHEVHGLLPTPAAYSPHSTRPSPSSGLRHSFSSVHQDRPMTQDTHREPYSPNTPQSRLETMQSLLLLFAVGLWGAKAILHEAMALQSLLALLVREEGLVAEQPNRAVDWDTWIRNEASSRTKLMAFCLSNLCSVAYNTPPSILTSEVNLFLPSPSRLWRAENAWQWQEARQMNPTVEIQLHEAFSRLLSRPPQPLPAPLTSLSNYVLIHALIQHIFFLKQISFTTAPPFVAHRGLKPDDAEDATQALRNWSAGFEQHLQARASEAGPTQQGSGNGDGFPEDAVASNSTALHRLANIRLHIDLSPSRSLKTRDHVLIASAFNNVPLLIRTPRLGPTVFQAIHTLSMLVKMGVNYVAKTKSLEWSMEYSLCNLECAVLLSKWLLTLASLTPADPPPTHEEKGLLDMVRRMLDETEFAVPIDPSLSAGGGSGSGAAGPSSSEPEHPQQQLRQQQQKQQQQKQQQQRQPQGPRSLLGMAGTTAAVSTPSPASTPSPTNTDSVKLRRLACAVIRLWAEAFKGAHVFDVVKVIAAGLVGYVDLVEKPRDERALLGRMGSS